MSDKNYVPASGESYLVRKLPNGETRVQMGNAKACDVQISASAERIDHQTQRILWAKSAIERRLIWVFESRGKRVLSWPGGSIALDAVDLGESSGASGGKLKPLKLTMPGKVVAVKVKEGDIVEAEQGLLIVEAMKMENLLLAPSRAKVSKIHVSQGDRLDSGTTLITFESAD